LEFIAKSADMIDHRQLSELLRLIYLTGIRILGSLALVAFGAARGG
jgi:hypothetical protein